MKILVMNDDGIFSEGIKALARAMRELGEVTVAAPSLQRSASSHSLTIANSIVVQKVKFDGDFFGYSISGTPADCGKIGLFSIMKDSKPDLVVSGINLGNNAGSNAIYSGTLSAAAEGAMFGLPSLAMSLDTFVNPDYSLCAKYAKKMAKQLLEHPLPKGTLLNVNVPAIPESQVKGAKITTLSKFIYDEWYDKHTDSHGRNHCWLEGNYDVRAAEAGSDIAALAEGYISLTPLHFDLTHHAAIEPLKKFEI